MPRLTPRLYPRSSALTIRYRRPAIGNFRHAARPIAPHGADALRVAGGVIPQGMFGANATEIQRVAIRDALRPATRATKKRRIRRAHGKENSIDVGRTRAAHPDVL